MIPAKIWRIRFEVRKNKNPRFTSEPDDHRITSSNLLALEVLDQKAARAF